MAIIISCSFLCVTVSGFVDSPLAAGAGELLSFIHTRRHGGYR